METYEHHYRRVRGRRSHGCEGVRFVSDQIVAQWDVDERTIIQLEATYTRKDARRVTLPAVAIWRHGDGLIDDYRIYVDLAPVYA